MHTVLKIETVYFGDGHSWRLAVAVVHIPSHYLSVYEGQSISFRIEFFALVRSVVTTPAARGIIPKVS